MENTLIIAPTVIQTLLIPLMLSAGPVILWNKLKKPILLIMFIGFLASFISVTMSLTLPIYTNSFDFLNL